MNVLVLNEQQDQLQNIEIDIIKSMTGSFQASEIIELFKDFFFNKMVLDVTALEDYQNPEVYKKLSEGLNPDKVIFFLPEGSDLCTSGFLSRLIKFGIYNFTTNLDGVVYLINNTNTYKDVEHIKKMADAVENPINDIGNELNNSSMQNNNSPIVENRQEFQQVQEHMQQPQKLEQSEEIGPGLYYDQQKKELVQIQNNFLQQQNQISTDQISTNNKLIVGIQNVTDVAGATSLVYMMKKELSAIYGKGIYAIELDKTDFVSYKDKDMISETKTDLDKTIQSLEDARIILVDLNGQEVGNLCNETIYLIEPSIIRLNTLMRRNKLIIASLRGKKVILNKSLLTQKEVTEFEYESGLKILYNMPPLNDRKRNEIISDFLRRMNIIPDSNTQQQTGIFGLFRK